MNTNTVIETSTYVTVTPMKSVKDITYSKEYMITDILTLVIVCICLVTLCITTFKFSKSIS